MNFSAIIQHEIDKRKAKNPQFSLRAFAKLVGVSPGLMSLVLNQKQPVSKNLARKILNTIQLQPHDEENIKRIAGKSQYRASITSKKFTRVSEEQFDMIANWYYYGILGLAQLSKNSTEPKWIASKLGITEAQARFALTRLIQMGFIGVKGNSFFQATSRLTTSSEIPSEAIRKHHRQNLYRAEAAIDSIPVTKRHFSSATFAIDSKNYELLCTKIERLRRSMMVSGKSEGTSKNDAVYTLAVQFFPTSQEFQKTGNGRQKLNVN